MGRMATANWEAAIVASLRQSRREGLSFTAAWKVAVMNVTVPRAGNSAGPAQLFTVPGDDPEEVELVEAMRGFCRDAWYGRKPALGQFSLEMLRDGDGSSPAHRAGHIRQAA